MTDQITMKLYRTSDLTETAALCSHGHPLHGIEVEHGWATFVIGYMVPDEEFERLVSDYQRGELLVEAVDFARRRNEIAARMRKALAQTAASQPCEEAPADV
jgi:hypothetical protein